MLVFLLSLAVLSVHGQNDIHQDETLRRVLSEVLSEMKMLKETVEKMQTTYVENADLQNETVKLRATVGKMQVLIKVQGSNADHQYEALMKKFDIKTETIERMQADNAALQNDIREVNRSRLMAPLICFSAVKTSIQEVSAGDNILFEEELIDTYDTYNPAYGVYVIPQDGVYEVIVTLYKANGSAYNDAYGDLYVGDTLLARILNAADSGTSAWFHSTVSIIQEFRAGDALHVVSYFDGAFYGAMTWRSSQFSAKNLGPTPFA